MDGLENIAPLHNPKHIFALTVGRKVTHLSNDLQKKYVITFHIAGTCDNIYKNQRCVKCNKILFVSVNGKSKFKPGKIVCEIKNNKKKTSRLRIQSIMKKEEFSNAIPCWLYEQN